MDAYDTLRHHLLRLLDWSAAHVDFETAIDGLPPDYYGRRPELLPYSPWQLVEHMRLAQHDILEFCRNPDYVEPGWSDDYWPKTPSPPAIQAWDESVSGFLADREAMKRFITNPDLDLFARIPHGDGQTYLREVLLVADHNAYHLGQLVAVRRLLGVWE